MFQYNPCTGQFTKNGKPVGWRRKDGYIFISQGRGKLYLAHRLAWKFIYGRWPTEIDHLDGNPSNNSMWNLKEVSHQENLFNLKFHRNGGKSSRKRPGHWHPRQYYLFRS